jgi:hypothetical protein
MGLRLTEYWRSCGLCLVKIAQSLLLFGLTTQSVGRDILARGLYPDKIPWFESLRSEPNRYPVFISLQNRGYEFA